MDRMNVNNVADSGITNTATDTLRAERCALCADAGADPCIDIRDLEVHFPTRAGVMGKVSGWTRAVDGVSFQIARGEVFAVVGESGCGKTTTAQAVMGLVPPTSGSVRLSLGDHREKSAQWAELRGSERKRLRRRVQIVFQDPMSSLNPRMTVRSTLTEPLIIHGLGDRKGRGARVAELMEQVGLSPDYLDRYPHEFSGGQRQRVGIARALATSPEFIVADEPVSALDVSIQAQIINLLQDMQERYSLTVLFISHDLAVVRHIANRIAVMYKGKILEMGKNEEIFAAHAHPYTELLLKSVPTVGAELAQKSESAEDDRDVSIGSDNGCAFYPRCPRRVDRCATETPTLEDVGGGHLSACFAK